MIDYIPGVDYHETPLGGRGINLPSRSFDVVENGLTVLR
jgi:hypothetical protein